MLIQYYDGANSQYAKHGLQATATTAAILQIADGDMPPQGPNGPNPPPADFGTTGTPIDRTFTVTNWGGGPASMVADGGTLGNGFGWTSTAPFGGGSCGTSLASGASCTVSVRFSPSGDGQQASTLSIAYNDGVAARAATRALTGTATTKAMIDIYDWDNPPPGGFGNNGPPFDFGVWGVANDHTFTLRNDGGGPASMMASGGSMGTGFAFKDGNYPGTTGDCGPTLAVGATCKIVVTFTPTGSVPLSGQVRVAYNDGAAIRTAVRAVSGTPTARAQLNVSEYFGAPTGCTNCGPFDWGTVPVGGSLEHTFTVYNTGALTATGIMPSGSLAAPFAFKGLSGYPGQGGNCAASLPAGQFCTLVLVFAPQSTGPATGSVGVLYDDSFMSPRGVERAMQGTGN
jgi:hypothetical protein